MNNIHVVNNSESSFFAYIHNIIDKVGKSRKPVLQQTKLQSRHVQWTNFTKFTIMHDEEVRERNKNKTHKKTLFLNCIHFTFTLFRSVLYYISKVEITRGKS